MPDLLSGLAGLLGGAVGMYKARQQAVPASTLACIDLALANVATVINVASPSAAYQQLAPREALAIVQVAERLGGRPDLLAQIRLVAEQLAASQTPAGYFDHALFYPADDTQPPTLTPLPGAVRADYTLYDMQHTVDLLRLLARVGVPVRDAAGLVGWIQQAQTPEGRFATEARYNQLFAERHPLEQVGSAIEYHHPLITGARPYSEIAETAYAVQALQLLGAAPSDRAACVAWLQAWQQPSGAFAGPRHPDLWAVRLDHRAAASMSAAEQAEYMNITDLDDTYWAVLALDALGVRPRRPDAASTWLAQALLVPSEYAERPQYPTTERWGLVWGRVEALYTLGARLPNAADWAAAGRRARTGGILDVETSRPDVRPDKLYPEDIVRTAESFRLLELLGGLDAAFLASFR